MKLDYGIAFENFRQLQTSFTIRAGRNPGFKGVLVACVLMALLGVFCIAKGMGFAVGAFLIGLGVAASIVAYVYDVRSVSKAKQDHDQKIEAAYRRVHCRERRVFQANENGFTASCQCGTVTRPWTELTGFSETDNHFALATKLGWEVLPKSAFQSQGEITEFRSLVTTRLNANRLATSRFIDFQHKRQDFRRAYILHTLKGGGWRGPARVLFRFACLGVGVIVIANALSSSNRTILLGMIGVFFAIQLLQFATNKREHYLGPLRIYFGDSGLHLRDPRSQSRHSWSQFIGYLENSHLILLYHNPRLYRIVPKRALAGHSLEFLTLVKTKLPYYDYRRPASELSLSPQSESKTSPTG